MYSGQQFINGQWIAGKGKEFISTNPADNKIIWSGISANEQQVDNTVNAARAAFKLWSGLNLDDRIIYITKFAELLEENKQELATIISTEMGKPVWESLTEVSAMKGKFKFPLMLIMNAQALILIKLA